MFVHQISLVRQDPVFVGDMVTRDMGPASVEKAMKVVAKEGFVSSSVGVFQQSVAAFPLMGYAFRMTIVEINLAILVQRAQMREANAHAGNVEGLAVVVAKIRKLVRKLVI